MERKQGLCWFDDKIINRVCNRNEKISAKGEQYGKFIPFWEVDFMVVIEKNIICTFTGHRILLDRVTNYLSKRAVTGLT